MWDKNARIRRGFDVKMGVCWIWIQVCIERLLQLVMFDINVGHLFRIAGKITVKGLALNCPEEL